MKKTVPDQTDPKSQIDKFKDLAREVGADGSEDAFDRALKKVAKASPEKNSPARSRVDGR